MLYVWKCWSVFRLYLEKFKIRVPPCEKSFYIQIKVGFIYTFWFTISSISLHHLINHFIYKIFTRITALDESTFLNPAEQFIFISLHSRFKVYWYGLLLRMRYIFFSYLFWVTATTQLITFSHLSYYLSCHSSCEKNQKWTYEKQM